MNSKTVALIFSLFVLAQGFVTADAGSIQGVVPLPPVKTSPVSIEKYRGKISGQVAPAATPVAGVWLEAATLSAPANPKNVTLSQTNYQFARPLIIIPTGTTVFFPNKDPDYHNIYSLSRPKPFDLGRYKKDEKPIPNVLFDKAGFLQLKCEIHDHMNASIIVVNSPYYTITDSKGRFTLSGIPTGSYVLHARLNSKKVWKVPVKIVSGKPSKIQFPAK